MLQVLSYYQPMFETFSEALLRRVEVACLQEFFNFIIKQMNKVAILDSNVVDCLSINASQRVGLMTTHQHVL